MPAIHGSRELLPICEPQTMLSWRTLNILGNGKGPLRVPFHFLRGIFTRITCLFPVVIVLVLTARCQIWKAPGRLVQPDFANQVSAQQ